MKFQKILKHKTKFLSYLKLIDKSCIKLVIDLDDKTNLK